MNRHSLSDAQWEKLQAVLPRARPGPVSKLGDRVFVDAVLYRARTGIPWRDLPERRYVSTTLRHSGFEFSEV